MIKTEGKNKIVIEFEENDDYRAIGVIRTGIDCLWWQIKAFNKKEVEYMPRYAIDLEDVPEEIEAKDYEDARKKIDELISVQECDGP